MASALSRASLSSKPRALPGFGSALVVPVPHQASRLHCVHHANLEPDSEDGTGDEPHSPRAFSNAAGTTFPAAEMSTP